LNNLTNKFGPVIREAIVLGIKDHAFDVLVPSFGIEKRVHLDQLPLEKFSFNSVSHELLLQWRSGVSSLEPLPQDYANEDDEEGLDVDDEVLLEADVNDYHHYELMDVTSLPIEDESQLFVDDISDGGYEDIEDEEEVPDASQDSHDVQVYVAGPIPMQPEATRDGSPTEGNVTDNAQLSSSMCTQLPNLSEPSKLTILSDTSIPNSQIIKELGHVQVYVTADCKKSPPVIKVLAVNPYEKKDM
jgi:protein SSD1